MAQDRAALQHLARERLAEARLLLANGHPSGAYYLAGYVLECALKAAIARQFRADEIPDLKRVSKIYSHDLSQLMDIAGLKSVLEAEIAVRPDLKKRWAIAAEWSERARYELWTDDRASAILDAIGGEEGLFEWLLKRS
ncbi:DNA-binding protein [Rhodopseudomonas palustris]|uniref:DNA-binding protein n=1 Tax=Rhodopseudomonas palustris TaxID=1076 RepID=A0A323US52_RHOPL|nr:HEPN domain-containing protein [Rhodopseudomonas palustris]PZA14036.1 DNA-binding protein [Rhodopseudomonas palustris]